MISTRIKVFILTILIVGWSGSRSILAQELSPVFNDGTIDARIHGIWEAFGYGWTMSIDASGIVLYHTSNAGCIKDPASSDDLARLVRYFRRDGSRAVMSMQKKGSTEYTFAPVDEIPAECSEPADASPQGVFSYFSKLMNEHYAFFDTYGVDWEERTAKFGALVKDDMSDADLFAVLSDMMDGLKDGHLELHAEIDGERERFRGSRPRILAPALEATFAEQKKFDDMSDHATKWFQTTIKRIRKNILKRTHKSAADDNVHWGRIGDIGYVAVLGMGGFREEAESLEDEIEAVHEVMNRVVADLADTKSLIFDVSLNQGGMDEVSLALASHFTEVPVLAYTKTARGASHISAQEFFVQPAPSKRYLNPVMLVSSDLTVSAAEIFVLAMRALPNVTHAGVSSWGAFSDILSKTLPNGWELELSNEIYRDHEGMLWEGKGVKPLREVPIFDADNMKTCHSDAILKIVDLVNESDT